MIYFATKFTPRIGAFCGLEAVGREVTFDDGEFYATNGRNEFVILEEAEEAVGGYRVIDREVFDADENDVADIRERWLAFAGGAR